MQDIMVPGEGLEPSLPCRNQILSLACLPVPPSRRIDDDSYFPSVCNIGRVKVNIYYYTRLITGVSCENWIDFWCAIRIE